MKIVKYNHEVFSLCVKYAYQGYADYEIASLVGVHKQTLSNWRRDYPKLKEYMDNAKVEGAKGSIERGLRVLAEGGETEETSEKYIEKRRLVDPETNEEYEIPVEITRKHKKLAPDPKAIELLARRYAKEYNKDYKQTNTINILEGFTMRDLQDSIKDNPIDCVDYEEKE